MKKKEAVGTKKSAAAKNTSATTGRQTGRAVAHDGVASISTAVQRLRDSMAREMEEAHSAGYEEGRAWATHAAPWSELEFLASDQIDGCNDFRDVWVGYVEALPSLEAFVEGYYRDEWRMLAQAYPCEFAAGFEAGAIEIWEAVDVA
mgnify:CR=1 FL=1